jgi:hypothetical protein
MEHDSSALAECKAEERNAEIERVKYELLSDSDYMFVTIRSETFDANDMAHGYAELASMLYQCEAIFADLFNGKTLDEIGKRRNLQPFRILESIRKDCHELVERCVVSELTDKFGSDE